MILLLRIGQKVVCFAAVNPINEHCLLFREVRLINENSPEQLDVLHTQINSRVGHQKLNLIE